MLQRDIDLADHMRKHDPELTNISPAELNHIQRLFYFRYLISEGHSNYHDLTGPVATTEHAPGFLETVILARDFQASVGHDKIFALWNLAQDKDNIDFRMDYNLPMHESFMNFAKAIAQNLECLDVIAATAFDERSNDFYHKAPSWCPDWTVSSKSSCLVRREIFPQKPLYFMGNLEGRIYNTDGGMSNVTFSKPLFEFTGDVLHCSGVIVDQIDAIVPVSSDASLSDMEEYKYIKFFGYVETISDFYNQGHVCPYENPRHSAWAMLHGDAVSSWKPRANTGRVKQNDPYPYEAYVCNHETSHFIPYDMGSYNRAEAWDVAKMMLKGRTPAITESGYMCLVPDNILALEPQPDGPWLVAIIATYSVPVLLQEVEHGTYKVCGSCYVQGWMEGEVITDIYGDDDARSFWASINEVDKLKII